MSRQQHHLADGERAARVSVRMPESLKRVIAQLAFDEGRSENAVMVDAIQEYVTKNNAVRRDSQAASRG